MEIFPDKRNIVTLVEQAYQGRVCLPNFQRDFVWTHEEVADLMRSLLRGYFVGSLLLLRCDPTRPPFAPIFLRGAKPLLHDPQPDQLVLDGQQRLTALLYALTAPNRTLKDTTQRRWFFINLQLLLDNITDEGIIFDRAPKELDGLDNPEEQYKRRIMPCTELFPQSNTGRWVRELRRWLQKQDPEKAEEFEDKQEGRLQTVFSAFANFQVAVIELPQVADADTEALGRVCAIFEKLNSTGVDLSVYDLLTARLYRSKIELHKLWDQACKQHKLLNEWSKGKADTNKFGVLLLRTVALRRGLEAKPSVLIDLETENFARDWARAAAAMEVALELVTNVGPDGFGVIDRKWLPGFGLIPVLAALRAEIEDHKLGEAARAELRRWYWCNVFLERYSSAVESKARKDYAELVAHWLDGKPDPAVFGEARARIGSRGYSIRDSASYGSGVYSGVFCLLALRGARDWHYGESIQLQRLEDHHIFPQAYLRKHAITKRFDVNSIVNRTLISDRTNAKIKAQAPAQYLERKEVFPTGTADTLLAPHFLTPDAVAALKLAEEDVSDAACAEIYEEFRRARETAIIEEIRQVCGIATEETEPREARRPAEPVPQQLPLVDGSVQTRFV